MRVFVYRNLHQQGHMYSIKSLEGISKGRVIGYAPRIVLENAELLVSQAGRNRVLRTRRKNVHAGIVGDLVMVSGYTTRMHVANANIPFCNEENFLKNFPTGTLITYNPFHWDTFVTVHLNCVGRHHPVWEADRVTFNGPKVSVHDFINGIDVDEVIRNLED